MKKDRHLYTVILAGGSGTRFWPSSRQTHPKQFLKIIGKRSLLQETLARIRPMIRPANVYLVTNQEYKKEITRQISAFRIPKANILLEPQGKNTAPAICWAAACIQNKDSQAVMAVLPSDHIIKQGRLFLKYLSRAVQLAQEDYLVTFGIVPSRPETGYGYLKIRRQGRGANSICKVVRFTEKPSLSVAKKFLETKKYLWNSGMFIWKTSAILAEFKRCLPSVYRSFAKGCSASHVRRIWKKLPTISVDYGILEKAKNVVTVEAKGIGWSDLGSWESLVEYVKKDSHGNRIEGKVIPIDCDNTFVAGGKRLIAAIGLKDIVLIDTDDALLVCRKEQSQHVRRIVEYLKDKKLKQYL